MTLDFLEYRVLNHTTPLSRGYTVFNDAVLRIWNMSHT